jgi:hypothetical protein
MTNWVAINRAAKRAMAHKEEAGVESHVASYALRTYGWESIKLNLMGRRSQPDRLFYAKGGVPLLIEFKRRGKKPELLQQHTISKLREAGYAVASCDSRETGCRVIDQWAAACKAGTQAVEATRLSAGECGISARAKGKRTLP